MTNYAKNNARTIYQSLVPEFRPNISNIHSFNTLFFSLPTLKTQIKKRNENCVFRLRDESVTKRRSRDIARGLLWVNVLQIWWSLSRKKVLPLSFSDRQACCSIAPPKCKNLRLILCVGVGLSRLQFTVYRRQKLLVSLKMNYDLCRQTWLWFCGRHST